VSPPAAAANAPKPPSNLLAAAWHVLAARTPYHDPGGDCFLNRDNPDHRRRRAIARLERLGRCLTLLAK